MLSKKESMIERLRSENMNGIEPKIAILNQDKVVNKKACCKFNFLLSSRLVRTKSIPIKVVRAEDERKELFISSYINSTINGISMKAPNIIRRNPTTKKTVLLLFIFDVGDYLKIFEIQHNKTLLYLYFTYEI